jgi:hypothetical protein
MDARVHEVGDGEAIFAGVLRESLEGVGGIEESGRHEGGQLPRIFCADQRLI